MVIGDYDEGNDDYYQDGPGQDEGGEGNEGGQVMMITKLTQGIVSTQG